MRLRNALALGVTAATTGTAVLALAVAPSSADPAPGPGPGSGADTGTERAGPGTEHLGSRVERLDTGSERPGLGADLSRGSGLGTGHGLETERSGLGTGHGLGTERSGLGTGHGLETERSGLGTGHGLETERSGLPTGHGLGTERSGLGTGHGLGTERLGPDSGPGLRSAPTPDPATEAQTKPPTCGKATDPVFPLGTRIQGGSGTYVPGADFQSFEVELTNTTAEPCHSIHPVLVLADRDRVLRPAQIRLDFYDSEASRWRPVQFEETDEDENIGVFNGFPGFAVPAGRTVTVRVRLAFREGTAPNEVVANAAIVQRRGDDGDWVGESDDYRLTIAPEGTTGTDTDTDTGTDTGTEPSPSPAPSASAGETVRPPAPARPELALTGPESTTTVAPASGALLLTGGALVAAARRGRRRA
ncbi:LPXTG cell wall anchor domain-containing protein [Streptomyces sp. NBC_01353]|uniref:LPXTG cell wall anchor domain-containing protein n=1 Tax=Streptomyces sp. NBC_01353 TaxID=2903835 RepID=UPI002E34DE20|nr:LPXTG cell wall anchor domain-containing protein [Streptomyces sp. NBC_01353]